jgi:C-terminal processing protease CtpA/Prc
VRISNLAYKTGGSILLAGLIAMGAARGVLAHAYQKSSLAVCDLIDQNYYRRSESEVQTWLRACRQSAQVDSFLSAKSANIARINRRLNALDVSHLALYSPSENRVLWENQGTETGIRARMITGDLVVTKVLPASPAALAGIKPGDLLVSLNEQKFTTAAQAQTEAGTLRYRRLGRLETVNIVASEMSEDLSPSLTKANSATGILTIPSFLSQYFDGKAWHSLTEHLNEYPALVIDLRGNVGGSFPAMLRAISPFRCLHPGIGTIYHDTPELNLQRADLLDELDSKSQLEQLHALSEIRLRAFPGYPCFSGQVTVLIDPDTSSVAEIFAQAFVPRAHSRIWGQPSAGQVVMAQWFPIWDLGGDDYSLSIPIAGYRTEDGLELESQGVIPSKTLFYDLNLALHARDSWIEAALQ